MGTRQTYGCISFALYWAWMFAAVVDPSLLVHIPNGVDEAVRFAGVAGLSAGLLLQYLLIPLISLVESRVFALIAGLAPASYGLALIAPGFASAQPLLLGLLLFAAGAAASLVLCGIGAGFSAYPKKDAIIATCTASSLGALIAALVSTATPSVAAAFAAMLMPLSVAFYRAARLVPQPEDREDRRRAFEVMRGYRPLLVFMFLYSALFGLVVVASTITVSNGFGDANLLVAICAPGVIMLFLLMGTKVRVDVESLKRILLALAIAGLLPLAFLEGVPKAYSVLALVITFGLFDIANLVTLYEMIRENGLPRLSTFAIGRVLSEAGIAVGWIIGLAISWAFPDDDRLLLAACAAVVALIVIGLAVFSETKESESIADAAERLIRDPYAYRSRILKEMERDFNLSPREGEVFEMLATGRSPKRISEKLFVSESTVKSHCHRIYQKLDIHSQQDLLDLFEKRLRNAYDNQQKLME